MSVAQQSHAVEPARAEARAAPRLPWTAVLHEWTTTTDHKKIGVMYVLLSLVFLVIGGIEALLMRWQLLRAHGTLLGPDAFNQLFTMHGTTMVFFVGMPILIGMGNYLVPLMIGARDMAFPRLNAWGFWLTLCGGLLVYFSFLTGGRRPWVGSPTRRSPNAHSPAARPPTFGPWGSWSAESARSPGR